MPQYKIMAFKVAINQLVDIKPGTIGTQLFNFAEPGSDINSGLFMFCLEPTSDLELKGEEDGAATEGADSKPSA